MGTDAEHYILQLNPWSFYYLLLAQSILLATGSIALGLLCAFIAIFAKSILAEVPKGCPKKKTWPLFT